jgi:phosphatidylinositol alpha 1,6-mannosyltransferase
VRVAVVSESFLPAVNGVTNSVLRMLEHFRRAGHQAMVIAPGPGPTRYAGAEVVRVPSVPLPRYRSFPLGLPSPRIEAILDAFAPDVVHLASPFALGAHGALAARRLGVPAVAAYQTDVAGWLASYRLGAAGPAMWRWLKRVHGWSALTLAPSTAAIEDLRRRDRGPAPPRRRPARLLAPGRGLRAVPPARRELERRARSLPVTFLGFVPDRARLAALLATADLVLSPGPVETFGLAALETLACGTPLVVSAGGALPELLAPGAGLPAAPSAEAMAAAVLELLDADLAACRLAARARAERFPWSAAVRGMLRVHRLEPAG